MIVHKVICFCCGKEWLFIQSTTDGEAGCMCVDCLEAEEKLYIEEENPD